MSSTSAAWPHRWLPQIWNSIKTALTCSRTSNISHYFTSVQSNAMLVQQRHCLPSVSANRVINIRIFTEMRWETRRQAYIRTPQREISWLLKCNFSTAGSHLGRCLDRLLLSICVSCLSVFSLNSLHSLSLFPPIQIRWFVSNSVFIHMQSLLQLKWNVNYDSLWKQWNTDKKYAGFIFTYRRSICWHWLFNIIKPILALAASLNSQTERSFLTFQTAKQSCQGLLRWCYWALRSFVVWQKPK